MERGGRGLEGGGAGLAPDDAIVVTEPIIADWRGSLRAERRRDVEAERPTSNVTRIIGCWRSLY